MEIDKKGDQIDRPANPTILVPIHKDELLKALLPPAIQAAKRYNGKIVLLNIVEKPYLASPQRAEKKIPERMEFLEKKMQMIRSAGCKGESQVEISPHIIGAIASVGKTKEVDLIVMGSSGNENAMFKNEIPHKLQKLDCSILAPRTGHKSVFDRVLLFVERLNNLFWMLEHASFLLSSLQKPMHVIYDFNAKSLNDELKNVLDQIKRFKSANSEYTGEITHSRAVETTENHLNIESDAYGSSCALIRYKGTWLHQLLMSFRKDPDLVAQSIGIPILLYKPRKY